MVSGEYRMAGMLTEADVQRLLASPSGDVRAETAEKVAKAFDPGGLTKEERSLAEEIFRVMVKDAEVMVREALSRNLKASTSLPHDVAMSPAKDIESRGFAGARIPVRAERRRSGRSPPGRRRADRDRQAPRGFKSRRQCADRSRQRLASVVAALVANPGAALGEAELKKVVEKHGSDAAVSTIPWCSAPICR